MGLMEYCFFRAATVKIRFGPFTFDLDTRQLTEGGGEIHLSPKAFELLAENSVQVIVSDQRMPEMNGTEFFGRVKDLYPATVRIMLSG